MDQFQKIRVDHIRKIMGGSLFRIKWITFKLTITSIGIGQPYPLSDLYKSYQEACLTLILLRVMGKKGFVREFSELGVFSFLFSQGLSSVKSFCLKTLGPLIEDDGNSTAVLLPTLRSLVDHGFNRSAAAKSLYVHINTLHYRLSKIEKLINADLSQPDVRANLYIAVKAWDALCQWRRKRGFFAPETV
jgi:DNA-binding PucR family transcriptional regulator